MACHMQQLVFGFDLAERIVSKLEIVA